MDWKATTIKGILIVVNAGVYVYALLFATFILAQYVNGWAIPESFQPPCFSIACDVLVRFVIWGGALIEVLILVGVTFGINTFLFKVFAVPTRIPKAILTAEAIVAILLFILIGVGSR